MKSCDSHLQIPLPQSPPWWLLFDADFEDMEAISLELLSLYRWPRVEMEAVEREITKLKEEYQVCVWGGRGRVWVSVLCVLAEEAGGD